MKVKETLEPFTLPLTVPLGPENSSGSVAQFPVSEEPDWTTWKVAVVPEGKKPVPTHVPVTDGGGGGEGGEGTVGLDDVPQPIVVTSNAEMKAKRIRIDILTTAIATRAFSS